MVEVVAIGTKHIQALIVSEQNDNDNDNDDANDNDDDNDFRVSMIPCATS